MNLKHTRLCLEQKHTLPYRYQQLLSSCKKGAQSWSDIKGWPLELIDTIGQDIPFLTYGSSQTVTSADGTVKAALTLRDGAVIETVLMQPKPGLYSVCVSCEVGCPMNCAFCATGHMGFNRVLSAEEITDQWLYWLSLTRSLATRSPSHIVFMGMGEPFHNRTAVFDAIRTLHDEYGVGWRKMSVSTSGIIPVIPEFARAFPQVNLAISLHAATDELRSTLMPVNRAYPLSDLKTAIKQYLSLTRRQIMFEYLLIHGVNDRPKDRDSLIDFCRGLPHELVHLNLIRYNPTGSFSAPEQGRIGEWKRALLKAGISTSIRKNLGTDIAGACGQLAGRNL